MTEDIKNTESIVKSLKEITGGMFYSKQELSLEDLKLEIKDVGNLNFPIENKKALELIKVSQPAKFGFKDKTLLDKDIRDTNEISKELINVNNKKWEQSLKKALEKIKIDLGISNSSTLIPHLHNMLVYEKGQFFKTHQDTEKLEGMVATLVVILPSEHSGGGIKISHQGDKKEFQTSRFALDRITCIAFYADCHHEIKKITKGFRVALTYNLVLERNKSNASFNESKYLKLNKAVKSYFTNELEEISSPKKLVYLLDHQYTQHGISWNNLKNVDQLRVNYLMRVAKELKLDIHLVLVDIHECWQCEYTGDRHYDRYSYYEDEEEDIFINDLELSCLIDSDVEINHWIDSSGKKIEKEYLYINDSEICWTLATDNLKPFNSEHEGYMGNYGDTVDKWYHRAAIVFWKLEDKYLITFASDATYLMNGFLKISSNKKKISFIKEQLYSLIEYWDYKRVLDDNKFLEVVIKLAKRISDPELARCILKDFEINVVNSNDRLKELLELELLYKDEIVLDVLCLWAEKSEKSYRREEINNLVMIVRTVENFEIDKKTEISEIIINYQLSFLKIKHKNDKKYCESESEFRRILPSSIKRLQEVLDSCVLSRNYELYIDSLGHVAKNIDFYRPINLINVVTSFSEIDKNINKKYFQLIEEKHKTITDIVYANLSSEYSEGPRSKDNWSIKETVPCDCDNCKLLEEFLRSKKDIEIVFKLNESYRTHLEQVVNGMLIPVSKKTEKKGRPYQLIISKTSALFSQSKKRFETITEGVKKLQKQLGVNLDTI